MGKQSRAQAVPGVGSGETAGAQFGALCWRRGPEGLEILLVTSRGTGRWIIPKGWGMRGKTPPETALREAWEEAGVKGQAGESCLGVYRYDKERSNGSRIPCVVSVYPVRVAELSAAFPEAGQRRRAWFPPDEAAALVDEPELRRLLAEFESLA